MNRFIDSLREYYNSGELKDIYVHEKVIEAIDVYLKCKARIPEQARTDKALMNRILEVKSNFLIDKFLKESTIRYLLKQNDDDKALSALDFLVDQYFDFIIQKQNPHVKKFGKMVKEILALGNTFFACSEHKYIYRGYVELQAGCLSDDLENFNFTKSPKKNDRMREIAAEICSVLIQRGRLHYSELLQELKQKFSIIENSFYSMYLQQTNPESGEDGTEEEGIETIDEARDDAETEDNAGEDESEAESKLEILPFGLSDYLNAGSPDFQLNDEEIFLDEIISRLTDRQLKVLTLYIIEKHFKEEDNDSIVINNICQAVNKAKQTVYNEINGFKDAFFKVSRKHNLTENEKKKIFNLLVSRVRSIYESKAGQL